MAEDSITKLFASLENEIKLMDNEQEKQDALLRLQELAKNYQGEDKVVSSQQIYEDLKKNPPQPGIMSGIGTLDGILNGWTPQQLIVLSGVTKHGKTSFAMFLTAQMAAECPAWLPFEESAQELVMKFIERGQEPPVFYTPQRIKDRTLAWCESKIVESKAKYGSKVIIIDHLGFITPRSENEAMEIGRVMRSLKDLAKKWNVVILVLAHLNKTEIDKHPNLEDLRGSAAIGQEADTVMFIWRETIKDHKTGKITITNLTNLSVQANRRTGKTGNIKLVFDQGRYVEEDWKYNESMWSGSDIRPEDEQPL